jgi:uncharacterized membrane protein
MEEQGNQDAGDDCHVNKWGLVMNTITLVVVMFILVLVLALQVQVRQTNKALDHFLKRMEDFVSDARKYAKPRNNPD